MQENKDGLSEDHHSCCYAICLRLHFGLPFFPAVEVSADLGFWECYLRYADTEQWHANEIGTGTHFY